MKSFTRIAAMLLVFGLVTNPEMAATLSADHLTAAVPQPLFTNQALEEPLIAGETPAIAKKSAAELRREALKMKERKEIAFAEEFVTTALHTRVRKILAPLYEEEFRGNRHSLITTHRIHHQTLSDYVDGKSIKFEIFLTMLRAFGPLFPTLETERRNLVHKIRDRALLYAKEGGVEDLDAWVAKVGSFNLIDLIAFLKRETDDLSSHRDLWQLLLMTTVKIPAPASETAQDALPAAATMRGDSLNLLPVALHQQIRKQLRQFIDRFYPTQKGFLRLTNVPERTLSSYLGGGGITVINLAALLIKADAQPELSALRIHLFKAIRVRVRTFDQMTGVNSEALDFAMKKEMHDFLDGSVDRVDNMADLSLLASVQRRSGASSGMVWLKDIKDIPLEMVAKPAPVIVETIDEIAPAMNALRPHLLDAKYEQDVHAFLMDFFKSRASQHETREEITSYLNDGAQVQRILDTVFVQLVAARTPDEERSSQPSFARESSESQRRASNLSQGPGAAAVDQPMDINLDSLLNYVTSALTELLQTPQEPERAAVRAILGERLAALNDYLKDQAADQERAQAENRIRSILVDVARLPFSESLEVLRPLGDLIDSIVERSKARDKWNIAQAHQRKRRLRDEAQEKVQLLHRILGDVAAHQSTDLLLVNNPMKWVRERYPLETRLGIPEQELATFITFLSPMSPHFKNILTRITVDYYKDGYISEEAMLNALNLEPTDEFRRFIRHVAKISGIRIAGDAPSIEEPSMKPLPAAAVLAQAEATQELALQKLRAARLEAPNPLSRNRQFYPDLAAWLTHHQTVEWKAPGYTRYQTVRTRIHSEIYDWNFGVKLRVQLMLDPAWAASFPELEAFNEKRFEGYPLPGSLVQLLIKGYTTSSRQLIVVIEEVQTPTAFKNLNTKQRHALGPGRRILVDKIAEWATSMGALVIATHEDLAKLEYPRLHQKVFDVDYRGTFGDRPEWVPVHFNTLLDVHAKQRWYVYSTTAGSAPSHSVMLATLAAPGLYWATHFPWAQAAHWAFVSAAFVGGIVLAAFLIWMLIPSESSQRAVKSSAAPIGPAPSRSVRLSLNDFVAWMAERNRPVFSGRAFQISEVSFNQYKQLLKDLESLTPLTKEEPTTENLAERHAEKIGLYRFNSELHGITHLLHDAIARPRFSPLWMTFAARDLKSGELLGVHMLTRPRFIPDLGVSLTIYGIIVAAKHHRQHIGAALNMSALNWLMRQGVDRCAAKIETMNVASRMSLQHAVSFLNLTVEPPRPASVTTYGPGHWHLVNLSPRISNALGKAT